MRTGKGSLFRPKDYIQLAPAQGEPEKPKNEEMIKRINADKEVCLTCTKKVCNGGEDCFRRRKSKMNHESKNTV